MRKALCFLILVCPAKAALITFTAGSPISASQINANFQTLSDANFWSGSSSSVYFTGGSVGIGAQAVTNGPIFQIFTTVTQADGLSIQATANTNNRLLLAPNLSSGAFNGLVANHDQGIIFNSSGYTGGLVLAPYNASATSGIRIASNGYVGIGASPSYPLTVLGGGAIPAAWINNASGDGATRALGLTVSIAPPSNYTGADPGDGNRGLSVIAVGSGRPAVLGLRNITSGPLWDFIADGITGNLYIQSQIGSGYVHFPGAIYAPAFSISSDQRLKTDIRPVEGSAEKLLALHGISYRWKDPKKMHNSRTMLGFSAQNVAAVFPEAVDESKDGYLSLNISMIIPPLVEAYKTLYERMSEYDRKLAIYEQEIVALKALVAAKKNSCQEEAHRCMGMHWTW